MYLRKDLFWRQELLDYCTEGPLLWAEGGHVYYAYTTADIIQGKARERLKRRSNFTKDWIPTNLTPLKNSLHRLSLAPPKAAAVNTNDNLNVVLTATGPNKVKVIKIIREQSLLDLKTAKELADNPPQPPFYRLLS